jgi:Ala-tRNA(Pro) deacylase
MNEKILLDFLDANKIPYTLFRHNPVFTCEDELVLEGGGGVENIPGAHSKNLFLKNKKNNSFFLVSVPQEKRVDLKELSKMLTCDKLSFGSPEELLECLKLEPGSVTPFGLLFDKHKRVMFILDSDLLLKESLNFHPLRNDMTLNIGSQSFLDFAEKIDHKALIKLIPEKKSI